MDLDPAIARAAVFGVIVSDGLGRAEPARNQPVSIDPSHDKRRTHRLCAPAAEIGVKGLAADVIGIALDTQLAGACLGRARDRVEQAGAG